MTFLQLIQESKKVLFLLPVLFFFLIVPKVIAADDWLLQRSVGTVWQSVGQYADKLDCGNKAVEMVASGVSENNVRCYNQTSGETLGSNDIHGVIDNTHFPTGPACSVETPSLISGGGIGYWGVNPPLLPCGVAGPNGEKVDCLQCGLCGFLMLGQRITYVIMSILFFIVVPIRLIWGGFQILISRGSSEMVAHGRKTIMYTIIGLLIAMSAFLIVQTFLWLLGGVGLTAGNRVGWPQINCSRNLPIVQ